MTACSENKNNCDGPFGGPDCGGDGDGGADDTGPTGGDGGSGDGGDGGSSGDTGEVLPIEPGVPVSCTPVTETTGDHFAVYYGEVSPPGPECHCSVTLSGGEMEVGLISVLADGDATDGRPAEVAFSPPWGGGAFWVNGTGRPDPSENLWNAHFNAWSCDIVDVGGTYTIRVVDKLLPYAGGTEAIDCADLQADDLRFVIDECSHFTGEEPPMPVNPLDVHEDDLACDPSSTATTKFELADFPSVAHSVPIAIDGERQHLYAEMDSITVTAWKGADRVRVIGAGGAQVTLTPSSSSATLANNTFWLGSARFEAGRVDSSGTWTTPEVSIAHTCPSSPGNGTRDVDQAYALDLETLSGAVDDATGNTGLAQLILSAPEDTWPIYVVRVFPIVGQPLSTGETHVLTLEVQGSGVRTWIPVTKTSQGHFDVDYDGGDWTVSGEVVRMPNRLTLDLDDGSVETPLGTLDLDPVVLQLDEYPDDGQ